MKTFKEFVNEAKRSDFTTGYEESQFGGYRAEVRDRSGKIAYLGQTAYKTPEAAEGEAEVYIDTYVASGGNDRKVSGAVSQYQKQNKGAMRS